MAKSKYAATLAELSRRVPCRYPTLLEYRKLPGFPPDHSSGKAKYDIEAVRQWVASKKSAHNYGGRNGHTGNSSDGGGYEPSAREKALTDKNLIAAERERFRLDVEKKEKLDRQEVNQRLTTTAVLIKRELYKAFEYELPPRVEGLSALEIKKANRRKLDQILREFPTLFANAEGKV